MLSRTISDLAPAQHVAVWCASSEKALYWPNRPGPNLCEEWQAFAGTVECGCARAKSATDSPIFSLAGVNRVAWILPASGPVSTVAIPEICPRSLILLAAMMKRLESLEMSVFRSVITLSCQMKPRDQPAELKVLPTTWPRLLMPVAKAAPSPGRMPRLVTALRAPFCQREATMVVPSAVETYPTTWPWSLMA